MVSPEHMDVLVVGAGISGIGAGYFLQKTCPDRTYSILEGRPALGGTWDLFRYPGIRSDSDMYSFGFSFKPWTGDNSLASGPEILAYLNETAIEFGIDRHIRYNHRVCKAEWSSESARWTVSVEVDEVTTYLTCSVLFMCSGYYSYKGGYEPEFEGRDDFTGTIIHPQKWPADLDYRDKRVVVIGSGATAVTLVPAMAHGASHVTMLQRSPTYVASLPARDPFAQRVKRFLPKKLAHRLVRERSIRFTELLYQKTRTDPNMVREKLLDAVRDRLGDELVDNHFTPTYDPWDQRLCIAPDGDFFEAIIDGSASVVTDRIDRFTETGIRLVSGTEVEADLIVTATGLNLVTLGEMDFVVDGEPVDFARTWTYKGLAYSGIPNLFSTFGYINASWTLRADLNAEYVCRLLNHMKKTGTVMCTPTLRTEDRTMPQRPWIDDFSAGYMQRMMPMMPRQGDRAPWINTQSYAQDKALLRKAPLADGVMIFR